MKKKQSIKLFKTDILQDTIGSKSVLPDTVDAQELTKMSQPLKVSFAQLCQCHWQSTV